MSSKYLDIPRGKLYWDVDVDYAFQLIEADVNAIVSGGAVGSTLVKEDVLTLPGGGRTLVEKPNSNTALVHVYEKILDPVSGAHTTSNITSSMTDVSLVPTMSGPTTPEGLAQASSEFGVTPWGDWWAWMAFNGNTDGGSAWSTAYGLPGGWLSYEFRLPQVVNKYRITYANSQNTFAPRSFTFEGRADNGWIVLDTQSNQQNWSTGETRSFSFSNTRAFREYRLNIHFNTGGADYVQVAELTMHGDKRASDFIDTRYWKGINSVAITLNGAEDGSNYWRYAAEVTGALGQTLSRRVLSSGSWTAADPEETGTNWMTEAQVEAVSSAEWTSLLYNVGGSHFRILCRNTGSPPQINSLTVNGNSSYRLVENPQDVFLAEYPYGWLVSNYSRSSKTLLLRRVG